MTVAHEFYELHATPQDTRPSLDGMSEASISFKQFMYVLWLRVCKVEVTTKPVDAVCISSYGTFTGCAVLMLFVYIYAHAVR